METTTSDATTTVPAVAAVRFQASAFRAAARCVADGPGRFALHGVKVDAGGTLEATDGRKLVRLIPHDAKPAEGFGKPMILHPGDTSRALKECERPTKGNPAGGCVTVSRAPGSAVACSIRAGAVAVDSRAIDGVFPPTDDVIPARTKGEPDFPAERTTVSLRLSVEHLSALLASMQDVRAETVRVQFTVPGQGDDKSAHGSRIAPGPGGNAIRFDASGAGVDVVAVLCPVVVGGAS